MNNNVANLLMWLWCSAMELPSWTFLELRHWTAKKNSQTGQLKEKTVRDDRQPDAFNQKTMLSNLPLFDFDIFMVFSLWLPFCFTRSEDFLMTLSDVSLTGISEAKRKKTLIWLTTLSHPCYIF